MLGSPAGEILILWCGGAGQGRVMEVPRKCVFIDLGMKKHDLFIRELSSFQTLFNKLHHLLDLIPSRFTSESQSENWSVESDA